MSTSRSSTVIRLLRIGSFAWRWPGMPLIVISGIAAISRILAQRHHLSPQNTHPRIQRRLSPRTRHIHRKLHQIPKPKAMSPRGDDGYPLPFNHSTAALSSAKCGSIPERRVISSSLTIRGEGFTRQRRRPCCPAVV